MRHKLIGKGKHTKQNYFVLNYPAFWFYTSIGSVYFSKLQKVLSKKDREKTYSIRLNSNHKKLTRLIFLKMIFL